MFEHPYHTYQLTRYEHEELDRRAELRRVIEEHADQIVPRPVGPIGRMLRRIGHTFGARPRHAARCEPATAR